MVGGKRAGRLILEQDLNSDDNRGLSWALGRM
jgi:hypothetical protein